LKRLRGLHVVVVGAGRSGSWLTAQLACLQPRRLTVLDADHLELHNLDGMALAGHDDVGEVWKPAPKATVLADHARRMAPLTRCEGLVATAQSSLGVQAMAQADILVSAADNDAARATTTAVAQLFLRPHLDLGSSVAIDAAGVRELGADLRLMLPGDGCLACVGGFAFPEHVQSQGRGEPPLVGDWRQHRAGSLASASAMVAAFGMRMLEELARGLLERSAWLRLSQADPAWAPTVRTMGTRRLPHCPLCAACGTGKAGLARLPQLLAAAARFQN